MKMMELGTRNSFGEDISCLFIRGNVTNMNELLDSLVTNKRKSNSKCLDLLCKIGLAMSMTTFKLSQ